MIGRELKRILQKPAALVCIIVYIGIMILGVETDLRADHESGILSLFYFTENYGVTAFIQTLIFPIAAAGNYFDERKGHYDWLMQMRSGQMKYCFAKIVSAVLSGIILYMISVLLFFVLCISIAPAVRQGSTVESIKQLFGGTISGNIEPFLYKLALSIGYYPTTVLYALGYSFQIGIYVLIGLCVSVFCTNRYVFYAMPFLLTRLGAYVGGLMTWTLYTPVGMERAADGGLIICLTRNLAAYAVLGFLYYREMKWRGING